MKDASYKTTRRGRWLADSRTRVTLDYGVKGNYAAGYHTGIDLAVPGDSHVAIVWALSKPGTVMSVFDRGAYGKHVVIRGCKGNEWLFAHLSKVYVVAGERVANGDRIGLTGSTGNATGDHLHLESSKGRWEYGKVRRPKPIWDY